MVSLDWYSVPAHRPSRPLPCRPTRCCPAGQPGSHLPVRWPSWPPPAHLPMGTLAATHHRKAPGPLGASSNLPRRCRQTGLDAKGVIPELLRLKFYRSWNGDFFFFFFFSKCFFVLLTAWLSTISPCWFFWFSLFFLILSFSFFSFFLGFVSFTIVN
jgi:hypothetical protein